MDENENVIVIAEENQVETSPSDKSKRTDPVWKHFTVDKLKKEWKCIPENFPQVQTQAGQCPNLAAASNENISAFERLKAEKRCSMANASAGQEPMSELEKAIEAYLAWVKESMPENINPIDFWANSDPRWKVLSEFALQTLSIPATSAAQERIFSYTGIATDKQRNQIGPKLLNQKVFIQLNKKFFE